MNLWPPSRASSRSALWTTLRALLLMWVALSGSALAQSSSAPRPEYISTPPESRVVNDQVPYDVTVSFASGRTEPASVNYPVVYWYINGNYVGQKTSTLQSKTVDGGGQPHYNFYDPYGKNGSGNLYQGELLINVSNTGEIIWNNSWPAAAGGSTALYTAYIPALNTFSPPAQIVVAAAQLAGGSRPQLQIVRSPTSVSEKIGGAASFFGEAQSHVNGLMQNPYGVAVDAQGIVYVADTLNHTIRKITPGGRGITIAGLDGVLLGTPEHPDDTSSLAVTTNFLTKLGSITVAILRGQEDVSTLKILKQEGPILAPPYRLVYTGSQSALWASSTEPGAAATAGTLGSTGDLVVSSLAADKVTFFAIGALNAGSLSGVASGPVGNAGTLTFDVYDPYLGHAVFKERAPVSGPAFTADPTLTPTVAVDLITDQGVGPTSYRKQNEAKYANRAREGQDPEPLFNAPESLTTADDGSIYVADTANKAIRRIYFDSNGDTRVRTLIAGSLLFSQAPDGGGLWKEGTYVNSDTLIVSKTVDFSQPRGILFDITSSALDTTVGGKAPVLYVLDFNSIKKVTLNSATYVDGFLVPGGSYVTSVSYIGNISQSTGWKGDAGVARLYSPRGMVLTSEDEGKTPVIYVADTVNHVIRKLYLPASKLKTPDTAAPADWVSEVVAGLVGAKALATGTSADGTTGYYPTVLIPGCTTGGGISMTVPSTVGIQVGDSITVAGGSFPVTKVLSPGTLELGGAPTAISGTVATLQSKAVSKVNLARLSYPSGLAIDKYRNLYFTEMGSHEVRRVIIDSNNPGVSARVQTLAGKGSPGPLDGSTGEGTGISASFFYPAGIVYDSSGPTPSLLVADSANHSIRRVAIKTTTLPTILGNASKGSYIVAVSSTSGLQKLMPVSGVNVSPGAIITDINGTSKTVTLNLPVTGRLTNTTLTATQETFSSTTALGFPGVKGNRDFSYECTEYTYQWRKYGKVLQNINTRSLGDTVIAGADTPSLTLSNLSERDSGPYELSITNAFSVNGETAQASLYVTPAASEEPKFLAPGYAQLSVVDGSDLTQLRPDLNGGVIDLALQAYVTPADAVSYQWQVYTGTVIDGVAAIDDDSLWINLGDTATSQNTKAASVLGVDGSGGLSLVGTNTSSLKIGGFQKSLIDYNAVNTPKKELPPALFRVICKPQDGRQDPQPVELDLSDNRQQPFLVQASYAPVIETGADSSIRWDEDLFSFGVGQQATLTGGASHYLTLTARALVSAYPTAPGKDPNNPLVRAQYQWMVSDKDPSDVTSVPVPVPDIGGSGDCFLAGNPPPQVLRQIQINFGLNADPVFYFVRYWTGSGGYADASTRIGEYVDGDYIKIVANLAVSVGSIGYADGETTPPESPVKIVYVNAPTESFQLDAIVDSASSKPIFSWEYLPWGADAASQWKTLYLGTLTSGAVSAGMSGSMRVSGAISAGDDPLNSGTLFLLGNGSISETLTRASLSFTSISEEAGDLSLNKDISGLYRLTATVDGISQHKDWVVAVRQKPYPKTGTNTYSLSTAAGGAALPGTPLILNPASKPSVTMQANVIFPSPDTLPVGEAFGSVYNLPDVGEYSWYWDRNNPENFRPFVDQYATAQKYRWRRGAVQVLPGTEEGTVYTIDGGTFKLANISGSKVFGTYSLTVTNACGSVPNLGPEQASTGQRGWTLLSNGLPELSQSEALVKSTVGDTFLSMRGGTLFQRVAEGQTVALEIPVASSYLLRYIWSKKNGTAWDPLPGYPVTGLPDSKYLIRAAKLLDSGTYRVKVGYVTSSGTQFLTDTRELTLLVEPAPSPAAPKVEVAGKAVTPVSGVYRLAFGSTATLSAMNNARLLFSGSLQTQFYAFQWKKNGVALVGQTGETLSLAGVSKAQAGVYTVDVSGVAGTKASPPVSVSVTAISSNIDTLWNLTLENVSKVRYTLSPSPTKGLAPGTIVSISGMSSDSQTLLGWRVSDEKGNSWNIERSSKFVMPGSHLKVSAVLGRPSIGMYSGFLSLDLPWDKSQEWAIHSEDKPVTPGASSVRGYFTAMVTSLATLSGKILIEGKSYAFTSPLTFKPDGTLSGIIKIQAPLSNSTSPSTPTPWNLSGTASLDMGLVVSGSLASGSNVIQVSDPTQLAALALDMSVSTYGLPEGTTINEIDRVNGTITVSLAATMKTGWVPMIVGANAAATHNVMHVKLNDVVLEKTPPKMTSGQTLYCTAACNAGAYDALRQFIAASSSGGGTPNVTSMTAGAAQTFTAAVFRYGSKDPSSCFGRGGALSTSVSALGLASVTGYLPNGSKLTYAGYIGRACLVPDKLTPAPLLPFVSLAKETEQTDAFGVPQDIAGTAVEIMQENLVRQTSSISIPIWSTSPAGDSVAEPLFGALLISDRVLEGCLGVLNSLPVIKTGLEPSGSEYTHNYIFGYLYEPTPPSGSQKVYPYTSTAKITLSTIAPSSDAATFPLEDVSQPTFLGKVTSIGNLGGTGSNLILTPSAAGVLLIQGDSFTLDNKTGLLLGSYSEPTSRYVSISQVLPSLSTGPSWAYTVPLAEPPKVLSTSFKASLNVRIYAVTIQGGQGSIFGNAGGASGFLMRGTAGLDGLKNVLGNGSQDPFLRAPFSTYRTEGFIMNAYEPY